MPGEAYKSWGSIVKESAYGTAPGSGEVYFELVRDSIKYNPSWQKYPAVTGPGIRKKFLGYVRCAGPLVPMLMFEGAIGPFLEGVFGQVATTPDTSIYTHDFTVKDDLPSYNIEINRGDVPADGKVFRYDGVMFDQYAFEWAGERQAQQTFTTVNKDRATNEDESGTQTYPGDYPLLFHHLSTVTIAAETTLAAKVKAMSLLINNNLQKDNFFNSRFKAKSKRDGDRFVNGTALFEFEDLALMDLLEAGTEGAFTLKLTSDLDIPSSSPPTKFSLEFSGDASFVSKADSDIADKSPIELPVSFELLGAAEITAQLINGEVSY